MTPHQKIMRAGKRGTGLRLTEDEVFHLSLDEAIAQCARNDDEAVSLERAEQQIERQRSAS